MSLKQDSRLRRSRKTRAGMRKNSKFRLCVIRSNRYISAQLIEHGVIDKILGCVSSNQAELKSKLKGKTSNKAAAELVGSKVAELAKGLKISEVSFDRSGYKYHGCVAELASAARAGGLKF